MERDAADQQLTRSGRGWGQDGLRGDKRERHEVRRRRVRGGSWMEDGECKGRSPVPQACRLGQGHIKWRAREGLMAGTRQGSLDLET